jgi:hypothetical protein
MAKLAVVPSEMPSGGINLDSAPYEIPNGMARYLQDVLLDVPFQIRQRGIIDTLGGTYPRFPNLPSYWITIGITSLGDPTGTDAYRVLLVGSQISNGQVHALVYGRGGVPQTAGFHARSFFEMADPIGSDGTFIAEPAVYFDDRRTTTLGVGTLLSDMPLDTLTVTTGDKIPFFDAKSCADGGVLFGIGQNYGPDPATTHRSLFHWRGAGKSATTTGTISWTQSSKTITGSGGQTWLTTVEPGMFLLDANARLLGVVASVTDNTHLVLERNVLRDTQAAQGYSLVSIRRLTTSPVMIKAGLITTSASSAVVTGGDTKFFDQGVTTNDLVFRAQDYTYIGKVASPPTNNIGLTLTAPATVALNSEAYIIVSFNASAPSWSIPQTPVFSAYWNNMQLTANADDRRQGASERSRIFLHDTDQIDAVDLTQTGSFIQLPTTKPNTDIRGIFPTESAALVFLAEATHGIFGTTEENLVVKTVLAEDGTLAPMSIQPWKGGAVWAGHRSIYWFDGNSAENLLAGRIQRAYREALANLDYSRYRAWSMLYNGHYILSLPKINIGPFDYTQERTAINSSGGATFRPDSINIVINLESGAVSTFTNVALRGFTAPPGKLVDERDAYYVVENNATTGPAIASSEALFAKSLGQQRFSDDVITNPAKVSFAPHVFVETRLNAYGDPERLKNFKQLQLQYLFYGATAATTKLGIDVVTTLSQTGLNLTSQTYTTLDQNATTWRNMRTKFIRRATHAAFRFYTLGDATPSSLLIGPMAVGMKLQRPGRV